MILLVARTSWRLSVRLRSRTDCTVIFGSSFGLALWTVTTLCRLFSSGRYGLPTLRSFAPNSLGISWMALVLCCFSSVYAQIVSLISRFGFTQLSSYALIVSLASWTTLLHASVMVVTEWPPQLLGPGPRAWLLRGFLLWPSPEQHLRVCT